MLTISAIGDLTENRVVIAGTSGELEDSANLTFDGTTLAVTGKETVSVDITVGSGVTHRISVEFQLQAFPLLVD